MVCRAEGVEEEAKLGVVLLLLHAEQSEDFALNGLIMDSDRAAAKLIAVEHQVIGEGADLRRIRVHERQVLGVRAGEGVMHTEVAPLFRLGLKEREVGHPDKGELVFRDEV